MMVWNGTQGDKRQGRRSGVGCWFGSGLLRALVAGSVFWTGLAAVSDASAASATRVSAFEYDATTGILTKEIIEPDAGNEQFNLITTYTLDGFGNRISATVTSNATGTAAITSRTTTTSYDSEGKFVNGTTNALGHSETIVNEPAFGRATSQTGPNGLTTTWTYDSFGRKTLEIRPDGNKTKWEYLYCAGVNGGTETCPANAKYLVKTTPLDSSDNANGPYVKKYFDMLNRAIRSETESFDASVVVVDTIYNDKGRVEKTSKPYVVGATPVWETSNLYDALGRPDDITFADGSFTSFDYNGLERSVTNELLQTKVETRNSQGQIVSIKDAQNNTITMTYDPFGNLLTRSDPNSNVTSFTYDIRGRKTAMTDPDMGTWSYVYNALGELVSQTDAKLQTVTFTYDKLGRPLTSNEPSVNRSWTYDTQTKGVGKIATATTGAGYTRTHSYDSLGRASSVILTIDSVAHSYTNTYDGNSRLSTTAYPSGLVTQRVYTALGYLSQIKENGTSNLYWQANTRDTSGNLTQFQHGNGVVTHQVFDVKDRLTLIDAGVGNNHTLAHRYVYDNLGNLTQRVDLHTNVTEVVTLDNLNRITKTEVIGGTIQSVTYDALGNITEKSDVGDYTYGQGGAGPHAVTEIQVNGTTTATYTYDANGNMTSGAGRTVTYTSFNKTNTIAQGATTLTFAYDTEDQRIKQVVTGGSAQTTIYLNDPASGARSEKLPLSGGGNDWNDYILAEGKMVAVRYTRAAVNSGTPYMNYMHRDHLGSVSVITDQAAAMVGNRLSYDAWGKRRFPNGNPDPNNTITSTSNRGYTGHEHLEEVTLIHMNARLYDPLLGRMMTADIFVQAPTNLQNFNRYSYVINNPLAYTDPNGYFFKSIFRAIKKVFKAVVRNPITKFIAGNEVLSSIAVIGATIASGGNAAVGAAVSAYLTAARGGSLGDSIKAFAISYGTSAAFQGIGSKVGDVGFLEPAHFAKIASHAAIGCAFSVASDGKCGSGALASGFGAIAGPVIPSGLNDYASTAINAAVGGTASVLGGGNFANGAITAAYGHIHNQLKNRGYNINLEEHEALGGHTLAKHVGKSPLYLKGRLLTERALPIASSFINYKEATSYVNSVLSQNLQKITDILHLPPLPAGKYYQTTLNAKFRRPTGYGFKRGANYLPRLDGVRVIIRSPAPTKEGFRVHSAYPTVYGDR